MTAFISVDDLRNELDRFAETSLHRELTDFANIIQISFQNQLNTALCQSATGSRKPHAPSKRPNPTATSSVSTYTAAQTTDAESSFLQVPLRTVARARSVPPQPYSNAGSTEQLDSENQSQALVTATASLPGQPESGEDEDKFDPLEESTGSGAMLRTISGAEMSVQLEDENTKKKVKHLRDALKKLRTAPFKGYSNEVQNEMDYIGEDDALYHKGQTTKELKELRPALSGQEQKITEEEDECEASGAPAHLMSQQTIKNSNVKTTADAFLRKDDRIDSRSKTHSPDEPFFYRNNNPMEKIVKSSKFEYFVTVLISLNAVFIGVATNQHAEHSNSEEHVAEIVIDKTFLVLFTVELCARIYVYRLWFWRVETPNGGKNASLVWNIFDTFIVGLQVIDFVVSSLPFVKASVLGTNVSILRLLRLVRILRLFRVGKLLKFVRSMHTILMSISQCIDLFFWSVMCLFLVTFIASVFFTEAVLQHRYPDTDMVVEVSKYDTELGEHFGSVAKSWLSLLKAVTGGIDWGDLSTPLLDLPVFMGVMPFLAYLLFSLLAIMNVITGIFLEQATERAKHEKEIWLLRNARQIFKAADTSHDGTITLTDFSSVLMQKEMTTFFDAIDLDIQEAEVLFELLDSSGDGTISSDEFLRGCLRLRGSAKALDLLILSREVTQLIEWTVDTINRAADGSRLQAQMIGENKVAVLENRQMLRDIQGSLMTLTSSSGLPPERAD